MLFIFKYNLQQHIQRRVSCNNNIQMIIIGWGGGRVKIESRLILKRENRYAIKSVVIKICNLHFCTFSIMTAFNNDDDEYVESEVSSILKLLLLLLLVKNFRD